MRAGLQPTPYEQGRAFAFQEIREGLAHYQSKKEKRARIYVQDCLNFEESIQAKEAIDKLSLSIEYLLDETLNQFAQALDSLEAGKTVYELTGKNNIQTYTRITGGDAEAGAMSVADDFMVMLMSFDASPLSKQLYQSLITSEDFHPDLYGAIELMTKYSSAVMQDELFSFTQKRIIDKIPPSTHIEYENGNGPLPNATSYNFLKSIASNLVHFSYRHAWRAASIPQAWSSTLTCNATSVRPNPYVEITGTDEPNGNPDFIFGFRDLLKESFLKLQDFHFTSRSAGTYAQNIELSPHWEKDVRKIADKLCIDLRDDILERLREEDIFFPGQTKYEGRQMAKNWLESRIGNLSGNVSHPKYATFIELRVIQKLKTHCLSIVDKIMDADPQPQTPNAQISGWSP